MKKQRILLIGGVDLINNPLGKTGHLLLSICDELESSLNSVGFTEKAPFRTIHLIFKYGENNTPLQYKRISKKYSELPATIEFDVFLLPYDDEVKLREVLFNATIQILLDVAKKYDLPSNEIQQFIK